MAYPKHALSFFVPKKDGDWRLIEDFRNVNVATEKFDYCMLDRARLYVLL